MKIIRINKLADGRIASVSYGNIIIYKKSDLDDLEKGIALDGSWIQIGTFTIKQNDNKYIINEEPISAENLQKLLDVAKKKLQEEKPTTLKTLCDGCGEHDMPVIGGRECKHCGEEYCSLCIDDHEKYCHENPMYHSRSTT